MLSRSSVISCLRSDSAISRSPYWAFKESYRSFYKVVFLDSADPDVAQASHLFSYIVGQQMLCRGRSPAPVGGYIVISKIVVVPNPFLNSGKLKLRLVEAEFGSVSPIPERFNCAGKFASSYAQFLEFVNALVLLRL